ncbi:histidine phosphatase family protein [Chengkuizengella axinellae]|uniref:Histidine phosphatase family protein n=1 Tax=Chengkuizengella axinellae TaxID=3064388 RepID=A0ABT9IWT1_9BACL|nr:histidine phosphatase family protein [Chengkuizengella sp. 2205SS18-9]MDP5273818.1 histidine phosphatase family protein [Chengkuizengella sp. 2205SS18-9]
MTIIGFVRHGVTDWNQKRIIQGHRDVSLNEKGRIQAAALGERLVGEEWDVIISSDLARAKETAAIIAERLSLKVSSYDERLRERFLGELEGLTHQDRVDKYGEDWEAIDLKELNIEEDEQLRSRGFSLIEDVQKKYTNKRVLIVSHGGLINQVLRELIGDFDNKIENTSISVFQKDQDEWKFDVINCTKHLKDTHKSNVKLRS